MQSPGKGEMRVSELVDALKGDLCRDKLLISSLEVDSISIYTVEEYGEELMGSNI